MDEATIDRVLEREPFDVRALVLKGDCRKQAGDDRTAVAFYNAALRAAAKQDRLPIALEPYIVRAQQALQESAQVFERHLEADLTRRGFPPDARPPRFQESLEILTGRRQARLQLQRPGGYYYPGLPQRRYYERDEFPWVAELEAAVPRIRAELEGLLASGEDRFTPYMVSDPNRPRRDVHSLVDNPDWSTLYLWENGQPIADHVARCPETFRIVSALDQPRITVRAPVIMFSRLSPGAHIPPHTGVLNTRLICHLPLIVPPGCGFRVGGETRQWKEGELLVFDDTVEHEAWNHGSSDRIVLIFDIWRPELSEQERRAITALFEAVDSYHA
ncbi:aspartyl/asparaginyl beta-hydroxylase domain-containing protein [Vulcaniibacterium gelatinicum]|uniref:aspartyl/asparaginyl beta-hydroxylase domain-containing protein n=1 Tax=Vulcaniibacterium gelatinicum TaxID=2598725 RepID=UPI0011C7E74F|nr:aspartyl/asparaginyl beta-hydroxylase domain-containing protein [Vulcaniibacterium gelatinicum]